MGEEDNKSTNEAETAPLQSQPEIPAEGIAPSGRSTLRIERQGLFTNAKKTLDFIDQSEKDRTVKIRVDDKRSATLVGVGLCLLASTATLMVFNSALHGLCLVIAAVADLFFGAAIIWYVALRFGVLRSLDPRYAVVCFQLVLGTGIFFTYLSINFALIFSLLMYKATGTGVGG